MTAASHELPDGSHEESDPRPEAPAGFEAAEEPSATSPPGARARRSGAFALAGGRVALGILLGTCFLALLRHGLQTSGAFLLAADGVRLAPPPDHHVAREPALRATAPAVRDLSLLDPALHDRVRERLLAEPWIESVRGVRRRWGQRAVELDVTWREPALLLPLRDGRRIPVDEHGILLASDLQIGPPAVPFLVAHGLRLRRLPRPGQRFRNGAILEACAVMGEIRRNGGHPSLASLIIERIELGERGRPYREASAQIRLVLHDGVRIRWGRSPLSPFARYEKLVGEKLDDLRDVMLTYPSLLRVQEIDLFPDDPRVTLGR